jgi:hypothetical protein
MRTKTAMSQNGSSPFCQRYFLKDLKMLRGLLTLEDEFAASSGECSDVMLLRRATMERPAAFLQM